MIFIVTILTFVLVLGIILSIQLEDIDDRGFAALFLILDIFIILICLTVMWYDSIPAIEVYKGNTTLQITYQDSIPIDSIVVYK